MNNLQDIEGLWHNSDNSVSVRVVQCGPEEFCVGLNKFVKDGNHWTSNYNGINVVVTFYNNNSADVNGIMVSK